MNELDYLDKQYGYQSNLQEQTEQSQERLYAPQLREQLAESQAAVIAQTNPARALKIILEGFRGNLINENNEVEKIGEPIMNEKGIARIASMLIPLVNDPVRFGNISSKEVRELALKIVNDITVDIGINWREYGIINPSYKDLILDTLLALIFITLTRSEEQGEKNWLQKIVLESIGSNKNKQTKGSSTWEKYFKL